MKKPIFYAGLLTVGVAGMFFLIQWTLPGPPVAGNPPPQDVAKVESTPVANQESTPAGSRRGDSRARPDPSQFSPDAIASEEEWQIANRSAIMDELQEFAAQYDPAFLPRITVHFDDPDPEIRRAAVEAVIQLGSREAIPLLKQKSEELTDLRERLLFLEAAEYLELPSWTELRAQGLLPTRPGSSRPAPESSNPAAP